MSSAKENSIHFRMPMRNFHENVSHLCQPKLITHGGHGIDALDSPKVTSLVNITHSQYNPLGTKRASASTPNKDKHHAD